MSNCSLYEDLAAICRLQNNSHMNHRMIQKVVSAKENGRMPQTDELVQFGRAVDLDFYRTVALILKGGRERCVEPDTRAIYVLFESHGQWASRSGYSQEQFNMLVREMMLAQLHMVANDGPEIESFANRLADQNHMLDNISPEKEQAWQDAKLSWLWLHEELGDKLMLVESRRLTNAQIQKNWMHSFGDAYIYLREQTMRVELFQLKNQFIEADPSLSEKALDEMVTSIATAMKMNLDDLRIELVFADYPAYSQQYKLEDNVELEKYLQKNKKLLRKIWMLIHPDRLAQHPSYEKLTQDQKQRIRELCHEVLRVRPNELRFQEDQIGYELRSEQVLMDILRKAESILQHAGINTDTDLIISGETADEQFAWLEEAIIRISRDINNATAELKALMEDQAVLEKEAMLNCDFEQKKKIRDEMLKKADDFKNQADLMEMKVEAHFNHFYPCH